MKLDTDIHNSDIMFSISLWSTCGPKCATIYDLFQVIQTWKSDKMLSIYTFPRRKTVALWITGGHHYESDNFTLDFWATLQNVFQKLFKENRAPWITRAQACEPPALPLWAGARFAQQCNIFAPILLFCILDLYFADLQRHWHIPQRGPWPQMLRIMTFSHKLGLWP